MRRPRASVWHAARRRHYRLTRVGAGLEKRVYFSYPPAYAMRGTQGLLHMRVKSVDVETGALDHPSLQPGTCVCLNVHNSGAAIPTDVQACLFDPFLTTKAIGEGTGMGLAIVHSIVTDHGGDITVNRTPENGTTFSIYLPHHVVASPALSAIPETLSHD